MEIKKQIPVERKQTPALSDIKPWWFPTVLPVDFEAAGF